MTQKHEKQIKMCLHISARCSFTETEMMAPVSCIKWLVFDTHKGKQLNNSIVSCRHNSMFCFKIQLYHICNKYLWRVNSPLIWCLVKIHWFMGVWIHCVEMYCHTVALSMYTLVPDVFQTYWQNKHAVVNMDGLWSSLEQITLNNTCKKDRSWGGVILLILFLS